MDGGDSGGGVVRHHVHYHFAAASAGELDFTHHAFGHDGDRVHRFQSPDAQKINFDLPSEQSYPLFFLREYCHARKVCDNEYGRELFCGIISYSHGKEEGGKEEGEEVEARSLRLSPTYGNILSIERMFPLW